MSGLTPNAEICLPRDLIVLRLLSTKTYPDGVVEVRYVSAAHVRRLTLPRCPPLPYCTISARSQSDALLMAIGARPGVMPFSESPVLLDF
jgi:hypothetical protein